MTLFHTLFLSLIEGLTEFLPVSSTGHLILAAFALGIPQTDSQKTFEIAIQLGAILAVLVLYGAPLLRDRRVLFLTVVAFIPTGIIGLLLHSVVKKFLLGNVTVVLLSLLLGGIVMIIFERFHKDDTSTVAEVRSITPTQAALIGVCQSIAIIPGVSRAAATIIGGQLLGIRRRTIVEFSFLLAIPTMAAATGYDLLKSASSFSSGDMQMLGIGFVASFLVALISIRWFLGYMQKHSLSVFGVYRIILAVLFYAVFLK